MLRPDIVILLGSVATLAFAQQHKFIIDTDELPTPCTVPSEAVERSSGKQFQCVDGTWRDKSEPVEPPTEPEKPSAATTNHWSMHFIPCRTELTITDDLYGTSSEQGPMPPGMGSINQVFCRLCDPATSASGRTTIQMYRERRQPGDPYVAEVSIAAGATTGFTRAITSPVIEEGDVFAYYVTDVTVPAGKGVGCYVSASNQTRKR